MNATREVLGRLAAGDEQWLQAVISARPTIEIEGLRAPRVLDPATRVLVQLAALFALDAATSSLRWAVDRACAMGADDTELVQVLLTAGSAAGAAHTVRGASGLALALDLDLRVEAG